MIDDHDAENREAAAVWVNHLQNPRVELEHYGTIRGIGVELRSTVDGHLVAKAEVDGTRIKRVLINKSSVHSGAARQAVSGLPAEVLERDL